MILRVIIVLPKCLQELPDVLLRGHEQEDPVDEPVVVGIGRYDGALIWVAAQVEDQWKAQHHPRIRPCAKPGVRRLLKEERKSGTVGTGGRMDPAGSGSRLAAIKGELASILEQLSGSKDKQE